MFESDVSDAYGFGRGPYPERGSVKERALDRFVLERWSRLRLLFGPRRRGITRFARYVDAHGARLRGLSDHDLAARADDLRQVLVREGFSHRATVAAFALVRETTGRHLGMRHHPVQLMGGRVMLHGGMSEMQTGEGKTLTAILPAATAALAGMPTHVITANDYLSERDCQLTRPVYEALGLSVGHVSQKKTSAMRREAYGADVTYCTGQDVAFDYLRDRTQIGERRAISRLTLDVLAGAPDASRRLLLRGLVFAVVDEADSIMIDDARTPLILSASARSDIGGEGEDIFEQLIGHARGLVENRHFILDVASRSARLTASGEVEFEKLSRTGLTSIRMARLELAAQALCALHLYMRDRHYIVSDGKIVIVDENTGRQMPDRSWENGLHQLVEAKEGCASTGRRRTIAKITYQRFFRRYLKLSGMTGTAAEAAGDFAAVYGLKVCAIPTHRALRRTDLGIALVRTEQQKWSAVTSAASGLSARDGRPVLIGTRSVQASEALGGHLEAAGLDFRILNARQNKEEAEIIAGAGAAGRITVATNMAGRGTDIHLSADARAAGGLHVILTEFHDSRRIDRQLFGRCGRQGDPGSFEAIVSLEDEIFDGLRALGSLALGSGEKGDAMRRLLRRIAQFRSERRNDRTRRDTMKNDDILQRALGFAQTGE